MKKTFVLLIILLLAAAAKAQTSPGDDAKADLQKTNGEIVKLFQQGKYSDALPLAQKAVTLAEQIFGKTDIETARALRNLGFIQNAKNNKDAAENAFEAALDIYKKFPDLDKPNGAIFAEMLEMLAFIKYQRRIDSAENLYEMALAWREKTGGADSIKTAKSLSALANISYWKKDYKKSARLFQRLLETLSKNAVTAGDDASLAFYRTECAFRKAEMENEFEPLREKYSDLAEGKNKTAPPKTGNAPEAQIIKKGVVNGQALNLARPAYPEQAKTVRAQGQVKVQVIINEEGNVIYACALESAHYTLTEAAEVAAYQSKFSPTLLSGRAVRVRGIVVYNFVAR